MSLLTYTQADRDLARRIWDAGNPNLLSPADQDRGRQLGFIIGNMASNRCNDVRHGRGCAKAQEASPVFRETATGMELELVWTADETMAKLHVTIPSMGHGPAKTHTMRLSAMQLDEFREFFTDNIEP